MKCKLCKPICKPKCKPLLKIKLLIISILYVYIIYSLHIIHYLYKYTKNPCFLLISIKRGCKL